MGERSEENMLGGVIKHALIAVVGVVLETLVNIILAPLAPPIQAFEIRCWQWLTQGRPALAQISWGWIGFSLSLLLALGVVVLYLFVRFSYLLRRGKRVPFRGTEPNPWGNYWR